MGKVVRHFKGGKEIPRVEKREHSPKISKDIRSANLPTKRGGGGKKGKPKVGARSATSDDIGSGNKSLRRQGKKVNDNRMLKDFDYYYSQQHDEQVDLYDIILSHLINEGYAETPEAAEVIMVNMSEDWRESICEGFKRFPYKKVEDKIHKKEADNPTGRGTKQSIQMGKVVRHFKGGKEIPRVEKREHSPKISKAKEKENRARGTQEG